MLSVRGLTVEYGRASAVAGVDLDLVAGEILALVGANGAGKSSVVHAICGLVPARGAIMLDGLRIDGRPFHRIAGLALSPEGRGLAPSLTVEETLRLGAGRCRGKPYRNTRADVLARLPVLAPLLDRRAGSLSGGQAQMLAIGRALMARPQLLLLDEPSLGLSPAALRELFALVARLRDDGLAVLLVEQNVHQALVVGDRAAILESGRIVASGPAAALRRDARLSDLVIAAAR